MPGIYGYAQVNMPYMLASRSVHAQEIYYRLWIVNINYKVKWYVSQKHNYEFIN